MSVPDIHKSTDGSQNHFRPEDFTIGKTLGTGTFARVSLAKLSKPKDEKERTQVYALKVLRKTEGRRIQSQDMAYANIAAVIRLRQVEHVRNERNVLAKVAGFPFITHMIASFQDYDSLYMLVSSSKYY